MKPSSDPIFRLLRRARDERQRKVELEPETPFGFATRVIARLGEESPKILWRRFALGSLPIAAVIAMATYLLPPIFVKEAPVSDEYQLAQSLMRSVLLP